MHLCFRHQEWSADQFSLPPLHEWTRLRDTAKEKWNHTWHSHTGPIYKITAHNGTFSQKHVLRQTMCPHVWYGMLTTTTSSTIIIVVVVVIQLVVANWFGAHLHCVCEMCVCVCIFLPKNWLIIIISHKYSHLLTPPPHLQTHVCMQAHHIAAKLNCLS